MKITVFGATGGIGTQIVSQASNAGHDVTAVVRDPSSVDLPVRKVVVDLNDDNRTSVESAVLGADAVLSGVGPRSFGDVGVASRGTKAIIDAMDAEGVNRLLVVSAAPVGTVASPGNPEPPRHDPGDGIVMRHLLAPLTKRVLRRPYADLAIMEDLVRQSGLDWTIVRPPRLTNKPTTTHYSTAIDRNVRGGMSVSRAAVANFMLAALQTEETIHHAVGIAFTGG